MRMAMLQMKAILACLLPVVRFETCSETQVSDACGTGKLPFFALLRWRKRTDSHLGRHFSIFSAFFMIFGDVQLAWECYIVGMIMVTIADHTEIVNFMLRHAVTVFSFRNAVVPRVC